MLPLIRRARAEDAVRIGAIARAAYSKYLARIGREPAPMLADFAAEIAADRVVVIGTDGRIDGYMIAWPETDAYFIDNVAVDPAQQGKGLGRQLIRHAVAEAKRRRQRGDDGELANVRAHGICRNASRGGEGVPPDLHALGSWTMTKNERQEGLERRPGRLGSLIRS